MSDVSTMERSTSVGAPTSISSKILLSKNEGRAAAEAVVQSVNSARFSIIEAAVLIKNDLDRFRQSREAVDGYLDVLVTGGVIAKGDARLGEKASKLSVYRKVGEHAQLISGFCRYFDPSLYVYYDVIRLFEALDRDEVALEHRLRAMAQLGVSRESLQQAIREIKSVRSTPAISAEAQVNSPSPTAILKASSGEFGLILATPSKSDIRLLAQDIADQSVSTPRCLRVHERTADTAVLLVASLIVDIPVVVQRLLPYCGFSDASHVFLMEDAKGYDIARCAALTVASRGDYIVPASDLEKIVANRLSPLETAASLATEDDGRLHLFATGASHGWTSIVGADNWSVGDVS
ncbi:MAG: hypothetical protein G4V63_29845 [Candidatus Afipia apatlaquensis]|uniref:Uncharacterized protein n=1 Tax=Candidatus Afipia apatlaquensis TaxID=2712852 RepID=A0A7C9VLK8_9BRAD|nr:hypothetical protein [Candidatus Afipia apatlaquensis]